MQGHQEDIVSYQYVQLQVNLSVIVLHSVAASVRLKARDWEQHTSTHWYRIEYATCLNNLGVKNFRLRFLIV